MAFEDINAELSKLTNDISSAQFNHGEVEFYKYIMDQLRKSIFQLRIHYNSKFSQEPMTSSMQLSY